MTRLDELKLAIYEKVEEGIITESEKDVMIATLEEKYAMEEMSEDELDLLECVNDGYMTFEEAADLLCEAEDEVDDHEDSSESKNIAATKLFLQSLKNSSAMCKKSVKEAESLIKAKKYKEAYKELDDTKDILKEMKNTVNNMPMQISDHAINTAMGAIEGMGNLLIADVILQKLLPGPKGRIFSNKDYAFVGGVGATASAIGSKMGTPEGFKKIALKNINNKIAYLSKIQKKVINISDNAE